MAFSFHHILPRAKGGWVQPPDAENRTSGGVGGWRGAIPVTQPDPGERTRGSAPLAELLLCVELLQHVGGVGILGIEIQRFPVILDGQLFPAIMYASARLSQALADLG